MKGICVFLMIASGPACTSPCLPYGETHLQGTLSIETFSDPPNSSSAERGNPEAHFFVSPAEPFCVDGTKRDASVESVSKIPIAINRKGGWPIMKSLLGTQVSCRGKLLPSHTGHHHSSVRLLGMCHAVEPGAPADGPRPAVLDRH